MSRYVYVLALFAVLHCTGAMRIYVDLTHILENTTIRFPTHRPFSLLTVFKGAFGKIPWVAMNDIETAEHMGTHMDSPYHFYEYGWKINEIPFDKLHGPAVVINIEQRAASNRDALVTDTDLKNWEERNGRIPYGAYVLMNSGWDQYWGNQLKAIGSNTDVNALHFPGFSKEAAEWLANNRPTIAAVGSDTVSCDNGVSETMPAHVILQKLNIMCIENVANLGKLPEAGVEVFAMPIKTRGTGAPIRMYAMWGDSDFPITADGTQRNFIPSISLLIMMLTSIFAFRFVY